MSERKYTFDQLVEHGRKSGCSLNGDKQMPWSFSIEGTPVTHENDECYIICGPIYNYVTGENGHFKPGDTLVFEDGKVPRIERPHRA